LPIAKEIFNKNNIGVWLISLNSAVKRRASMVQQLQSMQLNYHLYEAVDGHSRKDELIQHVDKTAYENNMGSPLLPGKMGVYASHLGVWAEFLASSHQIALVLEDDVVFHEDFHDAVNAAMKVKDQWDIIRFNCIRAKLPVKQTTVDNYQLNAYIGPFTGNATYLIKRDVATRLIPGLWPQTRALDHELNRFFHHNYRQLGLEPWASHPDDGGESTITGNNYSLVKKPHWSKRMPYYRVKSMNYFRRLFWLLKKGMLKPSRRVS